MSTSVMVAYRDPNRRSEPFSFTRNACFGQMNRLSGYATDQMEVMEWHPEVAGRVNANATSNCTPRKAFNFINSFGMWEGIFRMTPICSVATDIQEHPADAIFTGFMSMRDFQMRYNTRIGGGLSDKIEFALYSAGIYRNRYNSPALTIAPPSHGEGGVCYVQNNEDAVALYLLVYGTKEDFAGCWAQGRIGVDRENMAGYIRNSSEDTRRNVVRSRRPGWQQMADWLRTWLNTNPEHLQSKRGRLTVTRFYDGMLARLNTEPSASRERQAEIITNAFEELREMYA